MEPFLKWPGGKRWLAASLSSVIRELLTNTYYEPFLGGAAMFFELNPRSAVLSDINSTLINVYRQVGTDPGAVVREIKSIPVNALTYHRIRRMRTSKQLKSAVNFLYLNRTAWGGIYRVNADGVFN